MPRETIRHLSSDLERVLVAGAHLAAADPALAKSKAALDCLAAQLGAKAPAISQLAAAAGRTLAATGPEAVKELLGLATMAAQIRAAQAQPAAAPALEPLPPRPEIGTPCNAKELGELYTALTESGKGREEVVKQAIARGDIVDLRLTDVLIHAMNDTHLSDLIACKVVPRLGAAIIPPIRSLIDVAKGRSIDCKRLWVVVRADPQGSRDLLKRALKVGNVEMRKTALWTIASYLRDDQDFQAQVQALLATERSGVVYNAALGALRGNTSDAILALLAASLEDKDTCMSAAEALVYSPHPKAIPLLLEFLALAVQRSGTEVPGESSEDSIYRTTRPESLLREISHSGRQDPRLGAAAMELISHEWYGAHAAKAALPSASPQQLAIIANLISGRKKGLFPAAAEAATMLGAEQAFVRLGKAFSAKDRDKETGQVRLAAVTDALLKAADPDPRWVGLALAQLAGPPAVALHAVPLLSRFKERSAVAPLVALLAAADGKGGTNAVKELRVRVGTVVAEALGAIGDPAALDPLLQRLGHAEWAVRSAAYNAIVALDDPASVDRVRTLAVEAGDRNDGALRRLLRTLERRHPGK